MACKNCTPSIFFLYQWVTSFIWSYSVKSKKYALRKLFCVTNFANMNICNTRKKAQCVLIHENFHGIEYSLFVKFFCYAICFDERQNWRSCKRGLFFKSYCFLEAIAETFKDYKLSMSFMFHREVDLGLLFLYKWRYIFEKFKQGIFNMMFKEAKERYPVVLKFA